jgi:hypothetical protein
MPTNNHGKFLMSLNKRRCTAQGLAKAAESAHGTFVGCSPDASCGTSEHACTKICTNNACFTLCVPVAGIEKLVIDVGSTSGRDTPKFRSNIGIQQSGETSWQDEIALSDTKQASVMSKRQEKKRRLLSLAEGIPGLGQVPFGRSHDETMPLSSDAATAKGSENSASSANDNIFCISGTVAHLSCQVDCVAGNSREAKGVAKDCYNSLVDDDHFLVSATVVDAYCHRDYWDAEKNLFRPMDAAVSPYLTFFGSQRFGYTQG